MNAIAIDNLRIYGRRLVKLADSLHISRENDHVAMLEWKRDQLMEGDAECATARLLIWNLWHEITPPVRGLLPPGPPEDILTETRIVNPARSC